MSTATVVEPAARVPDDALYEVINGERVEVTPMGAREVFVATVLSNYLMVWGFRDRGRAVVEMLFDLPDAPQQRRPDVAFGSYAHWPRARRVPVDAAWAVVPELAVEVVSPTNTFNDVLDKMREYFRAGIQLVWLEVPAHEQVHAYSSPTSNRILTRADDLTGEPLLPGFRLPLAESFGDATED